jgi:NAD(P)H dehydrogenase (quinone)
VHKKDDRSAALEALGAEVVVGDLLEINTIRDAMKDVDAAYLVWPVQPGLINVTVNFAQTAKETGVKTVINLSQRSANRESSSDSCRDTYLAEEILNWSGLPVIHLRPTYFLECGVCQGSCRVNRYAACLYISAEARVRSGFR